MSLAAIILCIVRRKFTLERFDPMSAVTDTIVAFIGGGRFQMAHKLEKMDFWYLIARCIFHHFTICWRYAVLYVPHFESESQHISRIVYN